MHAKPVDPPEDWSGSLDIEREDYGVDLDEERPRACGRTPWITWIVKHARS